MKAVRLNTSVRDGVLCAVFVAAAVVLTYPVAEMGFQDDWSYIRTALEYARTGHFIYNGWATAMLGWTIPWAALFIKLFGFSFTIVRLSTLPLAMATGYLLHASLRRLGLGRANAILGTLTLVLSPVFLPMAASFMTDVAGLLAIVLCLYLCLRAAEASSDRRAIVWLCSAAVLNVIGGTARQISWLGALVMVPSTAWLLHRRQRSSALLAGGLLWAGSLAGIVALLHWWSRQPFSVPEHIDRGHVTSRMVHHFGGKLVKAFLCLLLLVFPVLVGWLGRVRTLSRAALIRAGAILAGFTAFLLLIPPATRDLWTMPWVGHLLYAVIWGRGEFPGDAPGWLSLGDRVLISLAIVATGLLCFEALLALYRQERCVPADRGALLPQEVLWILVPFSAAFFLLLLPRTLYEFIYDRYLVGIMPLMIVLLCLLHQRWVAPRMPLISFAMLALYSLVTIGGTHDWFATNRARLKAVNEVRAAGVPTTSLQGGFEFDGWTEIDAAGYINEKRIEVPRSAYRPAKDQLAMPVRCQDFFAPFAPAIQPRYLLTSSVMPCFANARFPSVPYRAWLPPFKRQIFIQRMRQQAADGGR